MAAQAQNYDAALDSIALDSIMSIVELQEIVVKGQLPNTRLKGNAMVTKVTGSVLEKAGTAQDVLRKVPGMIKKGDGLEVIGRGAVPPERGKKLFSGYRFSERHRLRGHAGLCRDERAL